MNRLDVLSQDACERALSADEDAELGALLVQPAAAERYRQVLAVHHGLRALSPIDVRAQTMQRVWDLEAREAHKAVRHRRGDPDVSTRRLAVRERPRRATSSSRRALRLPVTLAVVAAAAVAAVGLFGVVLGLGVGSDPHPLGASVVSGLLSGGGDVVTAGEAAPLGVALVARTEVDLALADGTRVVLEVGTRARLEPAAEGDRVWVETGALRAEVRPRPSEAPLVVASRLAEATVLGTALRFTVSAERSHLSVSRGLVALVDRRGGGATRVAGGEAAYVPATGGVIREADFSNPNPVDPSAARALPAPVLSYGFSAGQGEIVGELAGGPALRLADPGAARWGADGLQLTRSSALRTSEPIDQFIAACRESGAVAVEAWIRPGSDALAFDGAEVGGARIVTISDSSGSRNMTVGQGEMYASENSLSLRLRRDAARVVDDRRMRAHNGLPAFVGGRITAGEWVHIIASYDVRAGYRCYLDGVEVHRAPSEGGLVSWELGYRLALGDEPDGRGRRPWLGTYGLVALYDQSIDAAQAARLAASVEQRRR